MELATKRKPNLNSTKFIDFKCYRNMKSVCHFIVLKGYILVTENNFSKREKNKEVAIYYVPT